MKRGKSEKDWGRGELEWGKGRGAGQGGSQGRPLSL